MKFLIRFGILIILVTISLLLAPRIQHENVEAKNKCCDQIKTDARWQR